MSPPAVPDVAGEIALDPVRLLVFQGTPFCNIDCSYCYLPDRANRSRMSIETIERTCRLLVRDRLAADAIEILWHAGEPLVLPVAFYERAFTAIAAELPGAELRHKLQTNATLLDAHWIDFFRTWNVTVGVSLDGPPHIHDRHRTTRSRQPTSARVMKGVSRIKDAGIRLNVICVLTRDSLAMADDLFDFFEEIGIDSIGFNIDEAEGPHLVSSHQGEDVSASFHRFLLRYFERVVSSNSKQQVRELVSGLGSVFRKDIQRSDETIPIRILTVGHNGDFGTFSPDLFGLPHPTFGPLVFGNVADVDAFRKLARDPRFLAVVRSIQRGIDACAAGCGYFDVCKGGVPSSKLGEHGSFEATETTACKFRRQAVTDAVVELLLAGHPQPQGLNAAMTTVPNQKTPSGVAHSDGVPEG